MIDGVRFFAQLSLAIVATDLFLASMLVGSRFLRCRRSMIVPIAAFAAFFAHTASVTGLIVTVSASVASVASVASSRASWR